MDEERKVKKVGYIQISDRIRIKVETDCLTVEELASKENWRGTKYFGSWDAVLKFLVKRFTADKISEKEIWTFSEARKEIINSIKELEQVLLGGIKEQLEHADAEIEKAIRSFIKH